MSARIARTRICLVFDCVRKTRRLGDVGAQPFPLNLPFSGDNVRFGFDLFEKSFRFRTIPGVKPGADRRREMKNG